MFDAAARHLNFRRAALELNLTQGAVAQQVRQLEANLGYQLFHRHARGLDLTEIGRTYHNAIHRALVIIDDATDKLKPENTTVTLSITPSFASKWLVPRLADFARAYPGIDVHTVASEGIANFQSDGVDIAIRQGHPPFAEDLHSTLLAQLDLRALCSPELAQALSPIAQIADFAEQPLIQDSHNLWYSLFEEFELTPRQKPMQFNQTTLALDAAANGQGIALAPRILSDMDVRRGRLVELWQDTRSSQEGFFIVYPHQKKTSPAIVALIEWALMEAGKDT